jgi:VCBS repeat-containing protein
MSFITGTATDVGDLINQLNGFLNLGHSLDPQYTGTGSGAITNLIGTASTVNETITCTATDATQFTIVGSVSGALGTAVVGSAFTCAVAHFTIVACGTAWVVGTRSAS